LSRLCLVQPPHQRHAWRRIESRRDRWRAGTRRRLRQGHSPAGLRGAGAMAPAAARNGLACREGGAGRRAAGTKTRAAKQAPPAAAEAAPRPAHPGARTGHGQSHHHAAMLEHPTLRS
jgi:hypothetical protein